MVDDKKKKDKKAAKDAEEIVLERVYNVPLRREWLKVPKYMRAKKAGKALREFLEKHMKSDNVKIGKYANLKIWEHGIKNPPHHIQVNVIKQKDGTVFAELVGAPKEEKVASVLRKARAKFEKKPKKTKEAPKSEIEEKIEEKIEEEKEVKQEKAEEAKEVQKEEIKEMKKEHPKVHAPKMPKPEKNVEQHQSGPLGH